MIKATGVESRNALRFQRIEAEVKLNIKPAR